jgi:hypothetical protein
MNYIQPSIVKTNFYIYNLPILVPTNVIHRGLLRYDVMWSDVLLRVNTSKGHTVSVVTVPAAGNRPIQLKVSKHRRPKISLTDVKKTQNQKSL